MSATGPWRQLDLPRFDDARGALTAIEGGKHIPFRIARSYFIYGVPGNVHRGQHAHRRLHRVVIALSGNFEVMVGTGKIEARFTLAEPARALYVPPMVWTDINGFGAGSVLLSLVSDAYDAADYIRDYDVFLSEVKGLWS